LNVTHRCLREHPTRWTASSVCQCYGDRRHSQRRDRLESAL